MADPSDASQVPTPAVREGCEVYSSTAEGRGLRATQTVAAGRVLLTEKPYAAVVDDAHLTSVCSGTFVSLQGNPGSGKQSTGQRCASCKVVWYASKQAQKLDWRRVHKRECPCLAAARAAGKDVPSSLRLVARILWQTQAPAPPAPDVSRGAACSDFRAVQELEGHWDSRPDDSKVQLANIAVFVGTYMTCGGTLEAADALGSFTKRHIALMLARVNINGFTLTDEVMRPQGVGVFPFAAMLNHADRPNCFAYCNRGQLQLRALRSTSGGDPLTISYTSLEMPWPQLRSSLKQSYFFDAAPKNTTLELLADLPDIWSADVQTPWPQGLPCRATHALSPDVTVHFLTASASECGPNKAAQQSVAAQGGSYCWAEVQAKVGEDKLTAALAMHASGGSEVMQGGTCLQATDFTFLLSDGQWQVASATPALQQDWQRLVERDHLTVNVYQCAEQQQGGSKERSLACALGSALCALCLHWLSKVQFSGRESYEGALIRAALQFAEGAGLDQTHAMRMNAQMHAFQHAFQQDDLSAAVAAGMRYCSMCEAAKSDVSPHVGVQLRSIAQITALAQQWAAVIRAADLALRHLQVSHEGESVLLDAQQLLQMAAEMMTSSR